MSQPKEINYTNDVLEQMRCSVCKGYLSCSPVGVLPDGNCVCGRCSSTNSDVPVYRALPFEIILSQLSFPCQFKERGCMENVLFDQVADHECKCVYRSFACPAVRSCAWGGFTSQVQDHFNQQHPELVKESAEFKFQIDQDAEEVFMVAKDEVVFIIKYLYNVYENYLKYDVRCFMNAKKDEGMYKIQIINNTDSECNFNLKTRKCLLYDSTFYDMQNAATLNVRKYLEILNNPTSIAVAMNLKVFKSCKDSVTVETKVVDYKLLESVRCLKCKNHLITPLFDVNGTTVCCNCAKSYSNLPPSNNAELVKLLSKINYPCQWRNCNFVGNCENIQTHILSCLFRKYRCFIENCGAFVTLTTSPEHLGSHDSCEYLPNGIYKIIFSNNYSAKFIWTIKNSTLVVIKYWTYIDSWDNMRTQKVCLLSDLIAFTVTIQFEHQHCKLKSEAFVLSSNKETNIELSQLPFCFRAADELSISVSECKWTPTKA